MLRNFCGALEFVAILNVVVDNESGVVLVNGFKWSTPPPWSSLSGILRLGSYMPVHTTAIAAVEVRTRDSIDRTYGDAQKLAARNLRVSFQLSRC